MTDQQITIQKSTVEDTAAIARLVCELLDELSNGNGPDLAIITDTTQGVLSSGLVTALLAYSGEEPIAVMLLNQCAAIYAGGIFGEISELYVRPKYRSNCVATQLLRSAEQFAREQGWKRLEVGAPPQPVWKRTLEFYRREGFEEVGPRLRKVI